MEIKRKISNKLKYFIKNSLPNEDFFIDIDFPKNQDYGDLTTNAALILGSKLKKNPVEIAQILRKQFLKDKYLEKVEVVNPGFINFFIRKEIILENLKNTLRKGRFDFHPYFFGKNKKIVVEYAHPNTHKLFHIGHLRNISIGESISRILEASGNQVVRVNYQGDVGLHIAKCLWAVLKRKNDMLELKELGKKIAFLGECYTMGNRAYEEDEEARKEIQEINRQIYQKDKSIIKIWLKTKKWSLDYFQQIYKKVDTKFDKFYFESEMLERGLEIVNHLLKRKILKKSQQAVIFDGECYGLDKRVFLTKEGFPTYETKELALAEKEFSDFGGIDKCIHVVSPEQSSFFKVTFKVQQLYKPKVFKNKQFHLAYEWVNLKEGKMSSREGNIVEVNWLFNKVIDAVTTKYKIGQKTSELVALAAIKYSFLKHSIKRPVFFDFKESISLFGDSGPYLLYTFARTQSVLKKANKKNIRIIYDFELSNLKKIDKGELLILRKIYQFPEAVYKAAFYLSPHHIAQFIYDLANFYNLFYERKPIITERDYQIRNLRLLINLLTGIVIKEGLYFLGIKTVDKI